MSGCFECLLLKTFHSIYLRLPTVHPIMYPLWWLFQKMIGLRTWFLFLGGEITNEVLKYMKFIWRYAWCFERKYDEIKQIILAQCLEHSKCQLIFLVRKISWYSQCRDHSGSWNVSWDLDSSAFSVTYLSVRLWVWVLFLLR